MVSNSLCWVLKFSRSVHDSVTNGAPLQKEGNSFLLIAPTEDPERKPLHSFNTQPWGKTRSLWLLPLQWSKKAVPRPGPSRVSAVQTNTGRIHAPGSKRQRQYYCHAHELKHTEITNLPKVTQEVSGRAGNWTQISWIAGQGFNHKAIFRLSLSFSFPTPPQSFYFSTLLKKIALKNPFGNTLGMLWPPQPYLAQL